MNTSATFSWPNKHRTLVSKDGLDYEWVDPVDLRSESRGATVPDATDYGVVGEDTPTGVVVCGDGLDAVDLLVTQGALTEGSIRCVYVDPPFNTGKSFGHYRDAMAESAWLSMMRDRLLALRPLLAEDASVWIHLDETMSHKARLVADEVFGSHAYVATIVWQKRLTVESRTAISFAHDPILVYAPAGQKAWKKTRNRVSGGVAASNRDGDVRGPWRDAPFTAPGYRSGQQYAIVNPAGTELLPPKGRSWFATQPVFERLLAEDRIWWTKGGAGQPRMKNFDIDALQVPNTIWGGRDVGTNDEAKRHLATLFADQEVLFDTPKPETLLQRILHIATNPGELVVDLFAGSGTTAATAHKMGRRWIAAERLVATTENVLIPRLKKVVDGIDCGGISEDSGWAGGGAFQVLQVQPRFGTVPALTLAPQPSGELRVPRGA